MDLDDLLSPFPASRPLDPAEIADRVRRSERVLIVLDDDPTGTQSIADLPVLTQWEITDFEWALDVEAPAIYVLTNSRSFDPSTAERINREVVTSAVKAARARGIRPVFASRSDSTLRGHFPLEPEVIAATLQELGEPPIDGVVLVPAFPDAGRVTIGGLHGMVADGEFTPVGETEFARDSTFGYSSSRLADWVEEKSEGRIPAAHVVELDLNVIRAGAERVSEVLASAAPGSVFAADVVNEDDLRQLGLGLELAEEEGRSYIYRVGPPFVRARIGQAPRPPLEVDRAGASSAGTSGGLVVVGSHVGLTSRQLADLTARRPDAVVVELDVPSLLDAATAKATVEDAVQRVVSALDENDVIVHSSRTLIRTDDPDESLAISRKVSDALVAVVRRTLAERPPRFVIAKGGITSSDVASRGLEIRRAMVRGSLFPGIVSVWEPAEGPAAGIPYIVFAGNVGSDTTLTEAVEKLSSRTQHSAARR
ncbi:four-carbon acid sugar kinase family protein [Naasia sp. SYSU D00948]|uniref:four-carbon acid sugar kinase family protein n=1 Tax=Naasia sp. SYSU D00948 TaxID=2817379 RepID=UPI001B3156FD|nr:four-carbon acid sugar kinase family protein [Naasia sp. SYSU D00948]